MPVTYPYTFVNGPGNTVDATQVNANFTEAKRVADAAETELAGGIDGANLTAAAKDPLALNDASISRRGKSVIVAEENTTSAAWAALPTPDRVQNLQCPQDSILWVGFRAHWRHSAGAACGARIFVGSDSLKQMGSNADAAGTTLTVGTTLQPLVTGPPDADTEAVGAHNPFFTYPVSVADTGPHKIAFGGMIPIWCVGATTATVTIQFFTASGTLSVGFRRLWCKVETY